MANFFPMNIEDIKKMMLPATLALGEEVAAAGARKPEMKEQFSSLNQALEKIGIEDLNAALKLESLLKKDPAFKEQMRTLALNHPAALERIIPDILKKPEEIKPMVTAALNANKPRVTQPSSPQQTAPQATPPQSTPDPVTPITVTSTVTQSAPAPETAPTQEQAQPAQEAPQSAPQAPAPGDSAPAAAPKPGTLESFSIKLAEVAQIPGFGDLVNRMENNPQLSDFYSSAFKPGEGGDYTSAEAMLEAILERAGENPEKSTIFTDLVKTIDEKPGMVSTIAANFANDPKTGMMMVGMYSGINQGFGKILDGIFGPNVMDNIFSSLIGFIGKLFGQSGGFLTMSNNGNSLFGGLMQAFGVPGATPVSSVTPETGEVTTRTAEAYQPGSPQQLAENQAREERERQLAQERDRKYVQGQDQTPGQAPGSPTPAI